MAQPIESYLPGVRDNNGITTNEPTNLLGTSNTINNPVFTGAVNGGAANVVTLSIANGTSPTLTAAQSGSFVLMNATTGSLITLPQAAAGLNYTFIVGANLTTGTHAIVASNTAAVYVYGALIMGGTVVGGSAATMTSIGTSATSIRMNGTTSGGSGGTVINVVATAANAWSVSGQAIGSGVYATPFVIS